MCRKGARQTGSTAGKGRNAGNIRSTAGTIYPTGGGDYESRPGMGRGSVEAFPNLKGKGGSGEGLCKKKVLFLVLIQDGEGRDCA